MLKCPMTFINEQGLGKHVRNRHPLVGVSTGERLERSLTRAPSGEMPWEGSGTGRCWVLDVQFEVKDGGRRFPKSVKFMLKPRAADTVDPSEDPGMYDGFMSEIQRG